MAQRLSVDDIRALPATVDIPTAGRAFGLGRDNSYRLAKIGQFPVPVIRIANRVMVTRAALMQALGIDEVAQ